MLSLGRDRLIDQGVNNFLSVQLDAQNIPFSDDYFDLITIAFGLRNVTNKENALTSILRCLKPGGKLVILEFSKPENEMFREIYDLYSFEVIPKIGEWVAGSEESYRYLAESIRMHPNQEELVKIMEQVGFKECSYSNLTNGVVAVHSGKKRVLQMIKDLIRFLHILHILKARIDLLIPEENKLNILIKFIILPWSLYSKGNNRGERLSVALEEAGPVFIKFGQILSTRPDLNTRRYS